MAHLAPLVNLLPHQGPHRWPHPRSDDEGRPAVLALDVRRIVGQVTRMNEFGQRVGDELAGWEPPPFPPSKPLLGRTVKLEALDWSSHGQGLFHAFADAPDGFWTYMPFGPFEDPTDLRTAVESIVGYPDWLPYGVVVDGQPLGFASYLRINPAEGVIEIGSLAFSSSLQRTTAATEGLYLMIRNAFELGYRRCEWKCDDLNEPSIAAGRRLGFRYEGTFRNATHYKGRSRDTAWFSIVDTEWPLLDSAYRNWLSPENFDELGIQLTSLSKLTAGLAR